MACSNCGKDKVQAKGLCLACYHRLRRTGSVARTNVQDTGRCSAQGCGRESFAKNLCTLHYQRADHPLKAVWKLLRSRAKGAYPPAWDEFSAFLADVGERPDRGAQLRRIDVSKPYSTDNVRWVGSSGTSNDSMTREQRAAYGREWNLRRKKGITGADYDRMFAEQRGVCAICARPERTIGKNGQPQQLAVDHDHTDGAVRGLLCMPCNQGIGQLCDDPDLLRTAAAYIERHRRPRLACEAVA